jgi:hypothetical protein
MTGKTFQLDIPLLAYSGTSIYFTDWYTVKWVQVEDSIL